MILYMLLQEAEHGFELSEAARQFVQFLAWFAIFGPLGFRYVVARGAASSSLEPERELAAVDEAYASALRRAAVIGFGGAMLLVADLLPLNARNTVSVTCAGILVLAYGLARFRGFAWHVALLTGIVLVFQSIVRLNWATLINPIHRTAAALWIGTLFVLVSAGLPAILRAPLGTRRGPLVADLIARFSPLALTGAGFLVATGITTAWRHLGTPSALWSTAYGITLIVKLVFVAVVVSLGAWNWRRMTPRLGTEETAHEIRRSATAEVSMTLLVLVITAVLVSLPSPSERRHRPGRPGGRDGAGAPALVAPAAAGSVPSPGTPGTVVAPATPPPSGTR